MFELLADPVIVVATSIVTVASAMANFVSKASLLGKIVHFLAFNVRIVK